ncbi:uncharacterized protein EV422DRAFT_23956 [Fimicolochytrium jonesii]|uniref:uncharacterized protein n=1 Tax=Fimicolochytrium jonesii TaxID=1396493 RepID=UPI0022FED216|nr:uncharacterized protein EV422DRAFT_23956 [Fimicolochytrium jonesii]KAI8827067.1 hypothetical protein EV422DRAFT_23956 [Fimicolochytrium jonesii]
MEDNAGRLRDMEDSYKTQLDLLKTRGEIKESEVKRLGELNAELFGHANAKQKIKHVAQLKEENVKLKTENISLSRRCDDLKRKVMNLEREMESHRGLASFSSAAPGLGPNGRTRIGRVGRAALTSRQSMHHMSTASVVAYSKGGMSFVV